MIIFGVIVMGIGINLCLASLGIETNVFTGLGIGIATGGLFLALEGVRDGS